MFSPVKTILSLIVILNLTENAEAMKAKGTDGHSSSMNIADHNPWTDDLKGIKPDAQSGIPSNLIPDVGRKYYQTFRFQVLRKVANTGPGLLNSLIQYASKKTKAIVLEKYNGYGKTIGTCCCCWCRGSR